MYLSLMVVMTLIPDACNRMNLTAAIRPFSSFMLRLFKLLSSHTTTSPSVVSVNARADGIAGVKMEVVKLVGICLKSL